MDPFTHGTIGLAISAFSGQPVTLDNPVSIGCALGAMMPDIDAVIRLYADDMVYLKHHRGATHTVPFIAAMSAAVASLLMLLFPEGAFWPVFFWTFIGGLSHTGFDILNSYGAQLFRKKRKASLLTLYDPVVSLLALWLILDRDPGLVIRTVAPVIFLGYLGIRYWIREKARRTVLEHFSHGYTVERVDMLPSLLAFHQWDYIVTSRSHQIVGRLNPFTGKNTVIRKLRVQPEYVRLFNRTRTADYFNRFSPNLHVHPVREGNQLVLKVSDIRYYLRDRFMHHATVVLDDDHNVLESYFHPYHPERAIPVSEIA